MTGVAPFHPEVTPVRCPVGTLLRPLTTGLSVVASHSAPNGLDRARPPLGRDGVASVTGP